MKVDFVFDEGSSKEDTYLIGKNIFGVFDGANSINKFFDESGKPAGLIAASIVRDEFAKNIDSLKGTAISSNDKLRERMLSENIDISDKPNLWCSQSAVVRVDKDSFEWLQVGDSNILVIYKDGSFRLMVENYDHDRHVMIVWKKLAKLNQKRIKQIISANITYGVFNGEKDFAKFIHTGRESLDNVIHIILFTDGLILPKENPEESDDFGTFVKLFLEGGLENVKNHVRHLEKYDPECWEYPRYKQYDDIAAISISF